MNGQLRLPLQHPASFSRADLVVSPANAEAVAAVESWPNWHGGVLALSGPAGSGKSHLGFAWAQACGAVALTADASLHHLETVRGRPVLAEDASSFPDELLFLLINMAGEAGGGLLLSARDAPSFWPVTLPDLRSRLNAIQVAQLGPPDDQILSGVLQKFFRERNILPGADLLSYLVRRIERSVPAAKSVVARIDEAGDRAQRPITRALAREVLDQSDDLFADQLADPEPISENQDQ